MSRLKRNLLKNKFVLSILEKMNANKAQISELAGCLFSLALGIMLLSGEITAVLTHHSSLKEIYSNNHYILSLFFVFISIYRFNALWNYRLSTRKEIALFMAVVWLFLSNLSAIENPYSVQALVYPVISFNELGSFMLLSLKTKSWDIDFRAEIKEIREQIQKYKGS